MYRILLFSLTVILAVWVGAVDPAMGSVVWVEVGDAGRLPTSAQVTTGAGDLISIIGNLDDDLDVDVFKISVAGGGVFSATTVGLSSVDTRLFLFDSAGIGVYANDDADVFTLQSELPAGNPLTPILPGVYYLAVAGFDINPVSIAGRIFPEPLFPEELLGPTGPGGGAAVIDFEGAGDFGSYTIDFTGAFPAESSPVAVPEPTLGVVLCMLTVLSYTVPRRRKAAVQQEFPAESR